MLARLPGPPALQRLLRQSPGGARPGRAAASDHVENRSILNKLDAATACGGSLASPVASLTTATGDRLAQAAVAALESGRERDDARSGGCGPGLGLGGYPLEGQPRPHSCAPGPAVDSDLLGDVDGGGETAAARA